MTPLTECRFPPNGAWMIPPVRDRLLALDETLIESWLARHRDLPPRLYHYTSAEGFMGIVRSGKLWASAIQYCNDSSELRYGTQMVKALLEDRLAACADEHLREFLTRALRDGGSPRSFFVTCFCTDGDLLSQWRGYGAGGVGYAMGFNATLLGTATPEDLCLRKVVYDPAEQARIASEVIDAAMRVVSETIAAGAEPSRVLPPVLAFLHDHVSELALLRDFDLVGRARVRAEA